MLELQQVGRALRPTLWHLMQSDPCDEPDPKTRMGWKWLDPNNDPCDDWPVMWFSDCYTNEGPRSASSIIEDIHRIHSYIKGHDIRIIAVDFDNGASNSPFRDAMLSDDYIKNYTGKFEVTFEEERNIREFYKAFNKEPQIHPPYDFQRHNKTRKRRP